MWWKNFIPAFDRYESVDSIRFTHTCFLLLHMADLLRQEIAAYAHTIVVKVGTRVLTDSNGRLNESRIECLAKQLHSVIDSGRKILLVSSGAVGAGMGRLGLDKRPVDLAHLQAVAAVGQSALVQAYDQALKVHQRHAAQVLLTADGLDDRTRYLNARNTLLRLLDYGAIPIINENDTVSVAELQTTFGDNDRLAAMVTNLIRAPLLVLLSDVDGLYDRDPEDQEAKIIPTVTNISEDILALAVDKTTGHSKGGMASKLHAAKMCAISGENTIIASGRNPHVLQQILSGEPVGTLFLAAGATVPSWKRWIGFTAQPRGHLILDPGACHAITSNGSSLLAIGVVDVVGDFIKGDIVGLRSKQGRELARGLTNYSAGELSQIKGLHSDAITATLGYCPYASIIHRDNLALTG